MADSSGPKNMVDKAKQRKRRITALMRTQRLLRFSPHNLSHTLSGRAGADCRIQRQLRTPRDPYAVQPLAKADARSMSSGINTGAIARGLARYRYMQ